MRSIDPKRRRRGGTYARMGRTTLALGATAVLSLSAVSAAVAGSDDSHGHAAMKHATSAQRPIRASVITPSAGEKTSSGFNIQVSLQAKNARGNNLLSSYSTLFNDPTGPDGMANPAFHPGASTAAPGLVVTLSTTPNKGPATPLQGPSTNLAGVFQINSVTKSHGLKETWNDWQVTSPGFFGKNTPATLTVYAVRGKAPAVIPAGGLTPISNVVHETFRIGS